MSSFPQSRDEILARVQKLEPDGKDGDIRQVSKDVDVCLWSEPFGEPFSVDRTGNTRAYYVCANYGFFTAKTHCALSTATGVIVLEGTVDRSFLVPAPADDEDCALNWDSCQARAVELGRRDDCIAHWEVDPDGEGPASARDLLLRMQTLPG